MKPFMTIKTGVHKLKIILSALFKEYEGINRMLWRNQKYLSDPVVVLAKLRTYAHVLEKSLQVESWDPNHGENIYKECCRLIKILKGSKLINDPSFRWAQEKIRQYEESQTKDSLKICTTSLPVFDGKKRDILLEFLKSRRTVRSFIERKIENDILEQIVEFINWAPSSCCRQSTYLYITQNNTVVQQGLKLCAGATSFGKHVPCFIVVCGDERFYEVKDRDLLTIDAGLGVHNMLLAAHTFGIAGSILNWMHATSKEETELRKLLGIHSYHRIICNIVLGYPKDWPPAPGRKGAELTRIVR